MKETEILRGLHKAKARCYARGTPFVHAPKGVSKKGDKVPAMLEHGEAVLPKATVAKVGPQNIARLIAGTSGQAPQRTLRSGGHYADGFTEQPDDMRQRVMAGVPPVAAPAPAPAPASAQQPLVDPVTLAAGATAGATAAGLYGTRHILFGSPQQAPTRQMAPDIPSAQRAANIARAEELRGASGNAYRTTLGEQANARAAAAAAQPAATATPGTVNPTAEEAERIMSGGKNAAAATEEATSAGSRAATLKDGVKQAARSSSSFVKDLFTKPVSMSEAISKVGGAGQNFARTPGFLNSALAAGEMIPTAMQALANPDAAHARWSKRFGGAFDVDADDNRLWGTAKTAAETGLGYAGDLAHNLAGMVGATKWLPQALQNTGPGMPTAPAAPTAAAPAAATSAPAAAPAQDPNVMRTGVDIHGNPVKVMKTAQWIENGPNGRPMFTNTGGKVLADAAWPVSHYPSGGGGGGAGGGANGWGQTGNKLLDQALSVVPRQQVGSLQAFGHDLTPMLQRASDNSRLKLATSLYGNIALDMNSRAQAQNAMWSHMFNINKDTWDRNKKQLDEAMQHRFGPKGDKDEEGKQRLNQMYSYLDAMTSRQGVHPGLINPQFHEGLLNQIEKHHHDKPSDLNAIAHLITGNPIQWGINPYDNPTLQRDGMFVKNKMTGWQPSAGAFKILPSKDDLDVEDAYLGQGQGQGR